MRIIQVLYQLFAKRLRLSNPWNFKVPVLLSLAYLCFWHWRHYYPWEISLETWAWSVCTIIGIAGFGYVSNDLGDRKRDLLAGKPNILAQVPLYYGLLLALGFLGLAILPWLVFFPFDLEMRKLFGLEILLFVLYVLPPFRLKVRGFVGLVTDALYAHALPALMAMFAYHKLRDVSYNYDVIFPAFLFWQFFLGLRNILLHQLKDHEQDLKSGIRTFVVAVGEKIAKYWLAAFSLLELAFWAFFLVLLTEFSPFFLLAWVLFLLVNARKPKHFEEGWRRWLYAHCDDFYVPWFPLVVLLHLVWLDHHFLILLGLHWLLLKNGLAPLRDRLISLIWRPK